MADVRTHRCDNHLQAERIASAADQMGAELDGAVGEFVVRQQVVDVQDAIDAREIVRSHVHRPDVGYLVLDARDENADLTNFKLMDF